VPYNPGNERRSSANSKREGNIDMHAIDENGACPFQHHPMEFIRID
jgi:hypothetical protein